MATQGGGGGEPLASMGLERLKQEPWRLKAAHDGLSSELTALSLEHYRLHIENFECATVVKREVGWPARCWVRATSTCGSRTE